MEGYITFGQLGLLILFLVVVAVGGYAIIMIRSLNATVKDIEAILKENQNNLNEAIQNFTLISKNMAVISTDLRAGVSSVSRAMEEADKIASYAVVATEAAQTITKIIASIRKHI